ncbi:MAG: glycosyltransferase family 2 protein [Helicobacteraceae bacterium]|nr:glycosyltransferase family 2 protein [Helicobacteraceae bacterium]
MTKIEAISCVIIAKDAEKTIFETLESLKQFEEVLLYLNNSTDRTKEIAQNFPNVKIIEGEFIGFGPTKNTACALATNDWIFSLDSDEVLSPELLHEIKSLKLENIDEVFQIRRDNYFLGKRVKYSGWGNDYLVRFFNKTAHHFNDHQVHEFVELNPKTKVRELKNSFKHNAVLDLNEFIFKIAKYSDLASQNKKTCSFFLVLLNAKWAFLKTYIIQFGFLDGWRGFFIAFTNAYSKFFRYTKRYINCTKQ